MRALLRVATRVWFLDGERGWSPRLYEGFFACTRWGRRLRESEADTIVGAFGDHGVAAGRQVLEIGAGTGACTDLLVRIGARVEVREPSAAMRSYLLTRARRGRWTSVGIEDGSLPGPLGVSSTFAVVLAVGVLNYVPDLEQALRSMGSVLDPAGVVIINVPTAERPPGIDIARWSGSVGVGSGAVPAPTSRPLPIEPVCVSSPGRVKPGSPTCTSCVRVGRGRPVTLDGRSVYGASGAADGRPGRETRIHRPHTRPSYRGRA